MKAEQKKSLAGTYTILATFSILILTPRGYADEKYPSDQSVDENPYLLQPREDPEPDTWMPRFRFGHEFSYAELYGWLNKGLLIHHDGGQSHTFFPVDNDAGGSRIGVRLRHRPNDVWTLGINGELEWEPNSTINVDQTDTSPNVDWNNDNVGWRKGEIGIRHRDYGRLMLGQGPAAADNAAQVDFSGTISAGYSAAAAVSGGSLIRSDNGSYAGLRWRDVISNFDGFCCIARARYDSPIVKGVNITASVGEDIYPERTHVVFTDVALRYRTESKSCKMGAAAAYSAPDTGANYTINGSLSLLNKPSGLSVTMAGAFAHIDSRDAVYFYIKPGYQRDLFESGRTYFSIDAYYGDNIAVEHSTSVAFGAQFVQAIDYWKTEVYVGLRWFYYDDRDADYDSAHALLTGVRVRF